MLSVYRNNASCREQERNLDTTTTTESGCACSAPAVLEYHHGKKSEQKLRPQDHVFTRLIIIAWWNLLEAIAESM